jgi:hypothetical protein
LSPGLKKKCEYQNFHIAWENVVSSDLSWISEKIFFAASWQKFCHFFLIIFNWNIILKICGICRSQKILTEFWKFFCIYFVGRTKP